MTAQEQRAQLVQGLHDMANFLAANPDVPVHVEPYAGSWVTDLEQLKTIARAGDGWNKRYEGGTFVLERKFAGGLAVKVFSSRDLVCKKVVVGQREVPETPAREAIPAHVEDVVEWQCGESLLAPSAPVLDAEPVL